MWKKLRELELPQKQKVIATLDKVMELVPQRCKICGEIVTVQHTMSGYCGNNTVELYQWTLVEMR